MKREAATADDYIGQVEGMQHDMLVTVRRVIREVMPDVEEVIEYGMLGYPGLANLAAQKNYVALYVMPEVLARHRANFPAVSCGKSCLRFTRPEQVDEAALRALLTEVRERRVAGR